MKILSALLILFTLISCYHNPNDHDVRVAAKNFIRKEVAPASAVFAPDDKIKITKEEDKTFRILIYADIKNLSDTVIRRNWNLHLLYKGGNLADIKHWEILPQ